MTRATANTDPTLRGQGSCQLQSDNGTEDKTQFQRATLENPEKDEAGKREKDRNRELVSSLSGAVLILDRELFV